MNRRTPAPETLARVESDIALVLSLPYASDWLKDAIRTALNLDPVNAAAEANQLATLLNRRMHAILGEQLFKE